MERKSRFLDSQKSDVPRLDQCHYRTFIRIAFKSCYCSRLNQWISLQCCQSCGKAVGVTGRLRQELDSMTLKAEDVGRKAE